MPTDLAPPGTLPPRLVWFAVWRWKRRTLTMLLIATALVGYPLSIGPAMLLVDHQIISGRGLATAYRPVLWLEWRSPRWARSAYRDYRQCWSERVASWLFFDQAAIEISRSQLFISPSDISVRSAAPN